MDYQEEVYNQLVKSLLVSTIKDTLARFHSNLGHCVNYQIGFDCHGLPMEQAAENELGI